jgi:hypothetical protein
MGDEEGTRNRWRPTSAVGALLVTAAMVVPLGMLPTQALAGVGGLAAFGALSSPFDGATHGFDFVGFEEASARRVDIG